MCTNLQYLKQLSTSIKNIKNNRGDIVPLKAYQKLQEMYKINDSSLLLVDSGLSYYMIVTS